MWRAMSGQGEMKMEGGEPEIGRGMAGTNRLSGPYTSVDW